MLAKTLTLYYTFLPSIMQDFIYEKIVKKIVNIVFYGII